jgi:hypothetical protein
VSFSNLGSGTPVALHSSWTFPPSFVTLSSADASSEFRMSGGTTTSKWPDWNFFEVKKFSGENYLKNIFDLKIFERKFSFC